MLISLSSKCFRLRFLLTFSAVVAMIFIVLLELQIVQIVVVLSRLEAKVAKLDFCENLQCGDSIPICGIRPEGEGYRLKLFENECDLLKYGCKVENSLGRRSVKLVLIMMMLVSLLARQNITTYGVISMEYCEQSFANSTQQSSEGKTKEDCTEYDCSYPTDVKEVCGIRKYGEGFKIRLFENKCKLWKHNCEDSFPFTESEAFICDELKSEENFKTQHPTSNLISSNDKIDKNIVVVDSSMINFNNFNESIENFFAATHVFDLPMKEVRLDVNETSRRMLIKLFGPIKVFKPWITIPKNISDDYFHQPTLSSCYHKCPTKCPDTYAPVCGVPGIVAREPNLMFQNHCFMDVAQCKMFWEDKSPTAISSNYIESSFLFCLGDEMNGLYRFLPLVKTLQHMGRLKKKGHFRYKLKNMRFFNNLLAREPNIMG